MPLSLLNHSALALFAQRTRIPTSARSIGFCAIWVCISSSSSSTFCPLQDEEYEAGDTLDLVFDCRGTVSFTQSFVYLGSLLHRDFSDHHDVDARIKKASKAFGALRGHFCSNCDVSKRIKGKIYSSAVLAVLL